MGVLRLRMVSSNIDVHTTRFADVDTKAASGLPEFNAAALAYLESMGFPTIRCQKALLATGNGDAEAAMDWLFAHMEDPGKCLSTFVRFSVTTAKLIWHFRRYRRALQGRGEQGECE